MAKLLGFKLWDLFLLSDLDLLLNKAITLWVTK